jgi:hypothetical protein
LGEPFDEEMYSGPVLPTFFVPERKSGAFEAICFVSPALMKHLP